MSIIFFRFFLLYSVVANRSGPKTRYHRACSRSLTSLVLSRSLLRYCTKLCLIGFSAISASFSRNFSGLWAGFGSCFGDFYGFSYFFLGFFPAFVLVLGAVLGISAVSATFFSDFFRLLCWFWELFWEFLRFQLLFSGFFSAFGLGLGAVLGISAVSATFFWIFFGFWVDFGSCFKSFMDYSSTRACLLCYQPMAIVHYANLVLLNKYTFLTEGRYARPGHRWRTRTLLQAHSETV